MKDDIKACIDDLIVHAKTELELVFQLETDLQTTQSASFWKMVCVLLEPSTMVRTNSGQWTVSVRSTNHWGHKPYGCTNIQLQSYVSLFSAIDGWARVSQTFISKLNRSTTFWKTHMHMQKRKRKVHVSPFRYISFLDALNITPHEHRYKRACETRQN